MLCYNGESSYRRALTHLYCYSLTDSYKTCSVLHRSLTTSRAVTVCWLGSLGCTGLEMYCRTLYFQEWRGKMKRMMLGKNPNITLAMVIVGLVVPLLIFVSVFVFPYWDCLMLGGCERAAQHNYDSAVERFKVAQQSGSGYYDKAEFDVDKAIQANPDYAEAYSLRALIYLAKGSHAKAISDCDKAVTLERTSTIVTENCKIIYEALR